MPDVGVLANETVSAINELFELTVVRLSNQAHA